MSAMSRALFTVMFVCALSMLCRLAPPPTSSSAPSATQLDSLHDLGALLIPEDQRPTIENLNDFLYNYQQSAPLYR